MANQQALNLLTQLWELFKTVREGAAYLVGHPDNAQMQRDVLSGLEALHNHLEKDIPHQKKAKKQADTVFRSLAARLQCGQVWDDDDTQQLAQAAGPLAEQLSGQFSDAIREDTYLSREQAQPVFAFCDSAPRQDPSIYQLLFELCEKAAYTMPQESFEQTVRAMQEHPELLSGEGKVHPQYRYHPAPQRKFERCPICGGTGFPFYRALSYHINTFDHPHLPAKLWMRCGGCGNLYTWQYPEELLTQADHPVLIQPDPEKGMTAIQPASAGILSTWCNILNKLSAYTSGKELLEVGIGEGFLLAVALEMGYRPDAVEIVRQSAQKVADTLMLPIWNADFLDYHPDKKYAVIIMGDVIEHVTSPEQALRNAHSLLADDGVLWLSTPNFEGSFTRLMKFMDPMWLEPYHISYFSFAGLRALAEKCGFTVREYQVSKRYNGSMELILTKSGR